MINFKKTAALLLCAAMMVFAFAGCGNTAAPAGSAADTETAEDTAADSAQDTADSEAQAEEGSEDQSAAIPGMEQLKEFSADELLSGKHHVEMVIKDYGVLKLELDADQAPITVTNFCQLAKEGFYDGLTFHRILNDPTVRIIQGGDPLGSGIGGPGYRIKGEFTANGVNNTLSHTKGAISMARTSDMNGGGCQFFIMGSDYPAWDDQYACFGHVTEGIEIVDQICGNTQIEDGNGTVAPDNQPVMTKVTVID